MHADYACMKIEVYLENPLGEFSFGIHNKVRIRLFEKIIKYVGSSEDIFLVWLPI